MSAIAQYISRNLRLKSEGMNYKEYLTSSYWVEAKDFIKIDGEYSKRFSKCNFCGKDRQHLHHTKYSRIFARTVKQRLRDVIPLCAGCHLKVHEYSNKNKKRGLRSCTKIIRKQIKRGSQEFKNSPK